jgi:hypothetical protein
MGHGSEGGWDTFGPQRTITRSRGNVVEELDGEPALDLYERRCDLHNQTMTLTVLAERPT